MGRAPSDVQWDIPKGVLPAVDRVVELGIADPDRVGVMGQSFGGYSTFSLVTSTHRFRAAVALAGMSDYLSWYGTFRSWDRFTEHGYRTLANPKMGEAGQSRLGGSPWADLFRYLKNSPIAYLDHVETPLLILEGDQDFEGIEQSEEMFTGLYRLGKRARFVRYWGEGHTIESPANIRDAWRRIYEWFDTYLAPRQQASQSKNSVSSARSTFDAAAK
jgi:dipeptidyl aminopeptidase/acylaminoacyl peptidase